MYVRETIEFTIKIGERIVASIWAYVIDLAPADILLSASFLKEYSQGYNIMMKEFMPYLFHESDLVIACTTEGVAALEMILNKYPQLVLGDDEVPDPNRYYKGQTFRLGLPDECRDKVYYRAQYHTDPHLIAEYRKILEPLIRAGVYVECISPHNNPAFLVPKKLPGTYRLVVDNRLVNMDCVAPGGMRASTLDVIRAIGGAKFFTTIDCKNAFYSLVLDERDRLFTAIRLPGFPCLVLTRMPMGAKASTAALYQAMVATLGEALYVYVLVWADDIIIFSKTWEEHIKHVDDVLHRLDKNGFCITRSKIELGKTEVSWLGYTISAKGVRPDPEKVKRILAMHRPNSISSLRSALGMWTYFASFIPAYSIIAAPLFAQLKKDNPSLQWTQECDQAWVQIKEKLASAPIMGFPDLNDTLYMHTDACKDGFAAILTQNRNGRHVLIDAISRTTTPAEKNYASAKSECACVVWANKKWRHYLSAVPLVIIVTDSYGLQFLQQKQEPTPLVQRWIIEMEGINYVVHYHKGAENIADFLSRQKEIVACYFTRSKEQIFPLTTPA